MQHSDAEPCKVTAVHAQLALTTHLFARRSEAGLLQDRAIEELHVKQMDFSVCGHNLAAAVNNDMAVLQLLGVWGVQLLKAPQRQPQAR